MTTLIDDIAGRISAGAPFCREPAASESLSIHVLDSIGAWIAGRSTREGNHLSRLRMGASKTLAPLTCSTLDTAALRVATARSSEIDDIHMPSCSTPGAIVVMTALSLVSDLEAGGAAGVFTDALHTGYEIMTRFGQAVSGPEILHKGIWPTFLLAPVTTAGLTARLLNLDRERTAHALAIALTATSGRPGGSVSGGVVGSTGTSARWLLAGLAAKAGCIAALSAARGFNGDTSLLDGEWPDRSHGVHMSRDTLMNFYGGHSAVQDTSIKPYCAAKHGIAAINGFEMLLRQGIPLHAVTKVVVRVPPAHAGMIGHGNIDLSRLSRITSCGYNLALAAFLPDALLDIERAEVVKSAAVVDFVHKVEVIPDAQLALDFPDNYPASLEVFVEERTVASITVSDALGDPNRPFDMSAAQRKFRRLVQASISDGEAARIEQCCLDLDNAQARRELVLAMTAIDKTCVSRGPADQSLPSEEQVTTIIPAEELEEQVYDRIG